MNEWLRSVLVWCVVILLFVPQTLPVVGSTEPDQPAVFADLQDAGTVLLRSGLEASDSWESHERTRRRHQMIRSALGIAVFLFMPLDPFAMQAGGGTATMTVLSHGFLTLAPSIGGGVVTYINTSRAIENAGGIRGWYIAKAVAIAPNDSLEVVNGIEDHSRRAKSLGALLAASAIISPHLATPTSVELTSILMENPTDSDNLETATLVLQACRHLGANHPAVVNLLDYLRRGVPVENFKDASKEALQAANAYVYVCPDEVYQFAARRENAQERCRLLLSAADGAYALGDESISSQLVGRALDEARETEDMKTRVVCMATVAASAAGRDRRGELIGHVLAIVDREDSERRRMALLREISLSLASADVATALSILPGSPQPIEDVGFARELAEASLNAPPSEAHLTLVQNLPRNRDLTIVFNQLALLLAASERPSIKKAAEDAAKACLEAGPEEGSRDSEKHEQRSHSIALQALTTLASLNPDAAVSAFPERRKKKDPTLFASSELRLASVLAKLARNASAEPDTSRLADQALEHLQVGLSSAPGKVNRESHFFYLPEVGPAIAGAYQIAPDATLVAATQAPKGAVRTEALLQCSLAQILAGQSGGRDTLDNALVAVKAERGENKNLMLSRIAAVMSLVDDEQADLLLAEAKGTVWGCAASRGMIAGFKRDTNNPVWLQALADASDTASREGFAEERAQAVNWILDVTVTQPGEFLEIAIEKGLPWFSP